MIAADQLRRLNPDLARERAALFATVLDQACGEADLSKHLRVCHFLAQVAEETGGFRSLVESTAYRDPARLDAIFSNVQGVDHARRLIAAGPAAIGNTIYAHKNGNGDIASGDGYRFRGRGFLQITGRANYRRVGTIVGLPLEQEPEQLGEPGPAAHAAAAYWQARGINTPADADDASTVTRLVNGAARLHLAQRVVWLGKAKRIWT